jgi:hypothetical protein
MNTIQGNSLQVAPHSAASLERGIYALVGQSIADVERDLILQTLKHCLGNRTWTAKLLRISIRTLRNKINEFAAAGVDVPEPAHQGRRNAHGQMAQTSARTISPSLASTPHQTE